MTSQIAWPGGRGADLPAHARRADVRISVLATDPLVASGLRALLHLTPGVEQVQEPADAEVTVAVADAGLPELLGHDVGKLVLVADDLRQNDLWTAIERGLVVLVSRSEATDRMRLLRAIRDAQEGRGDLPAEQLGVLLHGLKRLQENTLGPRKLTLGGFSEREAEVIRLLADGLDTAEIAEKLIYSERTVKNVLHTLLSRLGLRNRAHAVAYALRNGVI
ncbi:DNA-binding response regulator, NarL/FixJ family, contains REC and HTH domains [Lentzea fradiae]|uniref:DNA-binding response regulator, NarL/FixJ family, contains REC and HTH domains n=1 Tax=Lentzea fradiae TaxID=200378 RepID=A0A1G7UPD0_9PSEU|nr:response regulator transcription factor [Lentzea fradiae]SDG49422.1 DNA-binding response regulator, NarL/FixJ family, contains REC and HTH domains [Lentzea fradiae]